MSDTYGPISKKLLATYNPQESSWKTSEAISHSDSKKFSKTLPKLGMTQDGQLFELVMLEHHTDESDCSASLNLPTPTASDSTFENLERQGIKGNHNLSLPNAVKLLPTPTARHVSNHDEPIDQFLNRQANSSTGQIGMSTGVALRLLPTPKVGGQGFNQSEAKRHTPNLETTLTLLATPTTNVSHTTGKCRNWGADLLHDVKCDCVERRTHWI